MRHPCLEEVVNCTGHSFSSSSGSNRSERRGNVARFFLQQPNQSDWENGAIYSAADRCAEKTRASFRGSSQIARGGKNVNTSAANKLRRTSVSSQSERGETSFDSYRSQSREAPSLQQPIRTKRDTDTIPPPDNQIEGMSTLLAAVVKRLKPVFGEGIVLESERYRRRCQLSGAWAECSAKKRHEAATVWAVNSACLDFICVRFSHSLG